MFNKILGNEKIKELLINSCNNNKISHSYMFLGVERHWKNANCKRICKNDFMP